MRRACLLVVSALICSSLVAFSARAAPPAGALPSGFIDTAVISGLTAPTAVEFAADGRIFIAEKAGLIKVFDGIADPTPTVVADLRREVLDFGDRGLSGLALHPRFPEVPYIFAGYSYDFDPRTPDLYPRWNDICPNPPGATKLGCVGSGRLVRLTVAGDAATEQRVLAEGWCIQFITHSVDDLAFGPDGFLYVSAGDGAHFSYADIGQTGDVCDDPYGEGGALRAQDPETPADPAGLDGTILRIDPLTGDGAAGNPFAASRDANARRVLAYGVRNPYRMAFRPGTTELWFGDVGMADFEEINAIADVTSGRPVNFGWPCFEGSRPTPVYAALKLPICEGLYGAPERVSAPIFAYDHSLAAAPGDQCPRRGSATTGLAFYTTGSYPTAYNGALFIADYVRECIWVMQVGADGRPDPASIARFAGRVAGPVDLEIGPGGDLYYVALNTGEVHRISYGGPDRPPEARIDASTLSGPAPLTVTLSAAASSDPDRSDPNESLTYAWDLDGDGRFNDASTTQVSVAFGAGAYAPGVRVSDPQGHFSIARIPIRAGLNDTEAVLPASAGWQLNGAARSGACGVELTPDAPLSRGSAIWRQPVASKDLAITFDAVIGGDPDAGGGDGIALVLLDPGAGPGALGFEGGNIGFGGLAGTAIALDTFRNRTDPFTNFIGVTTGLRPGGGLAYSAISGEVPRFVGAVTTIDVVIHAGRLTVWAAGRAVIETAVELPPQVLVGFTSATGGQANRHEVCRARVSAL